jgi:hypothetical protein
VSPLCSRNARSQKTLVGRAQWGTHPGHPGDNEHEQVWKYHTCSLAAALHGIRRVSARQGWVGEKSGLFEHPAGVLFCCATCETIEVLTCQNSFSAACQVDLVYETG